MPIAMSAPIVGMHFRPPAKSLLASLPSGVELKLVREADNPYDSQAVQVWMRSTSIPEFQYSLLEGSLAEQGFELSDVLGQAEWQLGYIGAKSGHAAAVSSKLDAGYECSATLSFSPTGAPTAEILLDLPQEAAQ